MLDGDTHILLTGVTGLIGGELIRPMLRGEVGRILCMVRPKPHQDVRTRLTNRLRGREFEATAWAKLDVLAGDVASPQFGLTPSDYAQVCREVDLIIHCASELSFIHDADCRRTNVTGMQNLIALARHCQRSPRIVHLSTAASCGVVTHRSLSENDGSDPENDHHNEYTRSKAVGERVLRESGLPALILRPSITLSAGLSSRRFARAIAWFLPLLRNFEAIPLDADSRLDVVPVSFVAESIVRLLRKPHLRYDCYNLSAGVQAATVCGPASAFLDSYYERAEPLQLVPPAAWSRECHRRYIDTPQRRKAFATLRYYLPFLNMDVVYDNTRLRGELGEARPPIPPLTSYLGDLLALVEREPAGERP